MNKNVNFSDKQLRQKTETIVLNLFVVCYPTNLNVKSIISLLRERDIYDEEGEAFITFHDHYKYYDLRYIADTMEAHYDIIYEGLKDLVGN